MFKPDPNYKDHIGLGAIVAALAFLCFALMNAGVKALDGYVSPVEVGVARVWIGIIPFFLIMAARRSWSMLRCGKPFGLFFRVMAGIFGIICIFTAFQRLPMADATTILMAANLLTPVLAFLFLSERLGPRRWLAILVGFGGVALITGPTFRLDPTGLLYALGAALMIAIAQTALRYMRKENPMTLTFYFTLGGMVLLTPILWIIEDSFIISSMTQVNHFDDNIKLWLLLAGIGLVGTLGQTLLALSLKLAPTYIVSPLNYTGLIWAVLFDIWIWHFIPGWPVLAGAGIIIGANLYIMHRERVHKRKAGHAGSSLSA